MKLYLTRQANGEYMLTHFRPVIRNVGDTLRQDAYLQPGEPIGIRNICQWGVNQLFGVSLEHLETTRVSLRVEKNVENRTTAKT